jgi:nitrite reductase/ring-hydroxylating ferredoxin subunit/DMSO/TMAO reductase YedYZ heme-binding membrane subunit
VSAGYKAVTWNRNKLFYDLVLVAGVALYIAIFTKFASDYWPGGRMIQSRIIEMRAYGSCAFLMLTLILCIGPLARLDRRFLPLLYNRRHFGVLTFLVALYHAKQVLSLYYNFGEFTQLQGVLLTSTAGGFSSLTGFPFEVLGILGLAILLLMAVTSHDFWQHFLSPKVWKSLHMLVYVAYALIIMHVALGALQSEQAPIYSILVGFNLAVVVSLHSITGWREWRRDAKAPVPASGGEWMDAGAVEDFQTDRARIVPVGGAERVAIFRYDGKFSAVSNVCAHQGGPLGEGRIVDGCVTCPWHGYQYEPHNGASPPPFDEKVPTYRLKLESGRVFVQTNALEPGTHVDPVVIG